jgi:hypothetical protein
MCGRAGRMFASKLFLGLLLTRLSAALPVLLPSPDLRAFSAALYDE